MHNTVEGDHTVFSRMYSYNDDASHLELVITSSGLCLRARLGHMGGQAIIPLVPDRRWNFRYNQMDPEEASRPIRDLSEKLTEIADWLDANKNKSFADYLIVEKLKGNVHSTDSSDS